MMFKWKKVVKSADGPKDNHFVFVAVGQAVDPRTGIAHVVLSTHHGAAGLTVPGARHVAKQINEWADHAEARNKEISE